MATPSLNWRSTWESRPRIVILPVGSFEQHGPHLPYETDTLIAVEVARRLASRLNAALLPPIPYGVSPEHMGFPGTITVDPINYCLLLRDIFHSLSTHGTELLVIVNGHGGNTSTLDSCATHWNMTHTRPKVHVTWVWSHVDAMGDKHAGPAESSIIASLLGLNDIRGEGRDCPGIFHLHPTHQCTDSGIVYNGPFTSSRELGERLLDYMVKSVLKEVCKAAKILGLDLDCP